MANSGSFNTTGYQGRYLTFSWSLASQSTDTNSSVISWSLKGAGNASSSWYNAGNFKVVINGSTVYSSSTRIKLYNGTVVASGSFTIAHNSDGSKSFSASAQAGIYYVAVNCSGSGSWSLPTINRYALITSVSNFNDTGDPSVSFTNPNRSNIKFELVAGGSTIATRTVSAPSSPYKFSLTEAERNSLRSKTPNSNTLTVTYRVNTLSGSTVINTSSANATMSIVAANPTISNISYADTNSTTTAITGDNKKIIQGNSTVSFTFGSLAALKGASLTSIAITVNAVTVTSSLSGTSASSKVVAFGAINSSSSLPATIVLTDSRNNKTTATVNITMLAWSLPTAIITCYRENNYYSNTSLNVNANYSSLGGANTITIQYQTKESGSSSWSGLVNIQDDVTTTISLDNTKAWDIRVIVTDRLGSTTYNLSVDRGIPIVYFDRKRRSVGFNCFPTENESQESKGVVKSGLGVFSFDTSLNGGTNGYLRIATVKIFTNYTNAPIEFRVFRRGDKRPVSLYLCFSNANNTDPSLNGLFIDSLVGATSFEAYAIKTDTSTWDIYVEKAESYDHIDVLTNCPKYMRDRVTIDYEEAYASTPPSGAIMATVLT